MINKTKCNHAHRIYDLYTDYRFDRDVAKLIVPSVCADCKCNDDEKSDYREDEVYYKRTSYEINPEIVRVGKHEYKGVKLDDLSEFEYEDDTFLMDLDNNIDSFVATFEAWLSMVREMVSVTITYIRCSKKEYKVIKNKV